MDRALVPLSLERRRALVLCDLFGAFVSRFRSSALTEAAWPEHLSFKRIIDFLFSRKLLSHRSLELLVYLVGHRQTFRSVDYYFTDDTESLASSSVQRIVELHIRNWVNNVPPTLPLVCCGRAVSLDALQEIPPPLAYGTFPGERLCAACGASDGLRACSGCLLTLYCGESCQRADYTRHHADCHHPNGSLENLLNAASLLGDQPTSAQSSQQDHMQFSEAADSDFTTTQKMSDRAQSALKMSSTSQNRTRYAE